MKVLQCTQNDVVVNFNDVIRIAHCVLNTESTQPVAILTLNHGHYRLQNVKIQCSFILWF